jgi:hypothetical protein
MPIDLTKPLRAVQLLRAENVALREGLRRQWEMAHSSECAHSLEKGKCLLADCIWPMPKILEEK